MKFTCETAAFSEAISTASRAVNPKTTIEALEGVLVRAIDGVIYVTGYDIGGGIGICVTCEGRVDEPGSIVLPVRTISEVVRKLPEEMMVLSTNDRMTATILSGDAESSLMGIDPADFPALPQVEAEQTLTLSYESLRNLTRRTSFAVAITDARPILMGVLFEIKGEDIRAVAVDGFRLGLSNEKLKKPIEGNYEFVVPGRSVAELGRVIKETDEDIEIAVSQKHLRISKGNITFVARLLEGKFITYSSVIPNDKAMTAGVRVDDMIESVDRVGVVINERLRSPLIMRFEEGFVNAYCSSSQGRVRDRVEAKIEGDGCELALNNRYLLDALKACDCEYIRFEILSPLSPIVIKPEKGEDFTFIVVPLKYAKSAE